MSNEEGEEDKKKNDDVNYLQTCDCIDTTRTTLTIYHLKAALKGLRRRVHTE